jgi:hypothetical protein
MESRVCTLQFGGGVSSTYSFNCRRLRKGISRGSGSTAAVEVGQQVWMTEA